MKGSLTMQLDAATATLIGIAITGIVGLFGTWLNNRHQIRLQREQWERQEKKAQIESEAAKDKASKDRLQDIYANAVRVLTEIASMMQSADYYHKFGAKHVADITGEAQKWLSMIVIYYYGDRQDTEYKSFFTTYTTFNPQDGLGNAEYLRRLVVDLASNDPRLK
jgi:hypothetical protein